MRALRHVISQFQEFVSLEVSAGILLLICTVVALLWANSPWSESYERVWNIKLSVGLGDAIVTRSLLHWINDGLMTLFFFVVGLEIKRETIIGELSSLKKASLPVVAALGGMIFPALLYIICNRGTQGESGWGIPMATDIAFSLGVLALLGKKIPVQLKVFLMAFAIADDIGAVIVIALFYASGVAWSHLLIACFILLLLMGANTLGIRSLPVFAFLGFSMWISLLDSGIHPTVAGVLVALTIPVGPKLLGGDFIHRSRAILNKLEPKSLDVTTKSNDHQGHATALALGRVAEEFEDPVRRIERTLHPWVTYVIVPLFALANAGVRFEQGIGSLLKSSVTLGVFLGLVVGKQIGITFFSWIAIKSGIAAMPVNVTWRQIYGVSWLGGIGFTMSLFIAGLAFAPGQITDLAKTGIYVASVVAAMGGLFYLGRNSVQGK